jgi:plasmid stabilization system protein ParE
MSVAIRPRAQLDILELADALGAIYPDVGRNFLGRVDETIQFLERFPLLGAEPPVPPPAEPTIRLFSLRHFRNFIIAFLPLEDGIEVVRVIDGRRDLGSLFDEL